MERILLKHYDPGVPHDIEIPDKTLPEMFANTVSRFPSHPHLKFMRNTLTYREVDALAGKFAAALAGLGLKKGSRLALNLPNSPQFVFCYLGALRAGCTVVPCNPIYTERELQHQLNDSEAEIIVTLSRFYPLIRKLKEKTKLRTIISTNIKEYFPGWLKPLYTCMEKKSGDRVKIEAGDYRLPDFLKNMPPPLCPMSRWSLIFRPLSYTGELPFPKGAILTTGT